MSAIRIAVTGKAGQVVRSLIERASAQGVEVVAVGRPELDLLDAASVARALTAAKPHAIVNAAAYTTVDRAEHESDLAFAINEGGASAVAAAAHVLRVPVVQVSTDYVFDGGGERPYREDDATGPLGAYGRSKLAAEAAVVSEAANHAILRTAWVYSPFGSNFLKTMLRVAATRSEISVVADQRGNPTNALDLADGLVAVVKNLLSHPSDERMRGVFHMASAGETHWADFAQAIFDASAAQGGPTARGRPIATADYPTPARRPANSRLDCTKLARIHGVAMPAWRPSVAKCVARVLAESRSPQAD